MSPAQIVGCAETLVQTREFNILHLEDYPVFFSRCLAGEYGPIEYSIDQLKICIMLRKFIADWNGQQAKNQEHRTNNNIYESQKVLNMVNESTGQTLGDVYNEAFKNNQAKEKLKVTEFKPRELTPQERFFQDLLVEFDEIYEKSSRANLSGEKVIWMDDRWMDRNDFVEFKTNKQVEQ